MERTESSAPKSGLVPRAMSRTPVRSGTASVPVTATVVSLAAGAPGGAEGTNTPGEGVMGASTGGSGSTTTFADLSASWFPARSVEWKVMVWGPGAVIVNGRAGRKPPGSSSRRYSIARTPLMSSVAVKRICVAGVR